MQKKENYQVYSFREKPSKVNEIEKKCVKWGFRNPSEFIRTATQALLDVKNKNV